MKELHQLLQDLDNLQNNFQRKEYLNSILRNPNLGRHELKRITCNILVEEDFVDKYYRINFAESLKIEAKKLLLIFRELLENKRIFSK